MPGNIIEAMMLSKGVVLEDHGRVLDGGAFEADIDVNETDITNKSNKL